MNPAPLFFFLTALPTAHPSCLSHQYTRVFATLIVPPPLPPPRASSRMLFCLVLCIRVVPACVTTFVS